MVIIFSRQSKEEKKRRKKLHRLFFSPNHRDRRCSSVRNRERERGQSAAVRVVRQFSSSITYGVKKKKERERQILLAFLSTHFAFLHLLSSRNMLGVAAAAVVRRQNTDNNQRTIYVVVVVIILSRKGEKKNEEVQ